LSGYGDDDGDDDSDRRADVTLYTDFAGVSILILTLAVSCFIDFVQPWD